jgi:hypothetical protein
VAVGGRRDVKISTVRAYRLTAATLIATRRTKQPPEHRFVRETEIFPRELTRTRHKR